MSKRYCYKIIKKINETTGIMELEIIKKGPPPGPGSGKPKKPTTRELLVEFMRDQKQFNQMIASRLDNIENRLDNLENRLDTVIKLNNLKTE